MYSLCYGCMKLKQDHPKCELCGFDAQTQNGNHQLPLGTIVGGQYILGRVLGQGGFGITYLGWDRILDRRVAVKEYFPSGYAGRDTRNPLHVTSYDNHSSHDFENNKKRFLREAESLARLWDVPQIVKVLRHFEDNGTAYIAMEFVEGSDLRKYLQAKGRPLTMAETLQLLGPVMQALSQVHKVGLVHRDISPDNIMVLPDGSTKLLDFGAARYVENANAETDRNTSTQAILKHGFAPPEQYRTHGALGPWTDIYAMCATVYYCLTGKIPPEAMGRTMEGEQIHWNAIPGLTEMQKAALAKGMEILPKNRFASMEELWTALSSEMPAPVRKQARNTLPEEKPTPPVSRPKAEETKPGNKKKKWIPLLLGILLAAAVSVFAGIFLLGQPSYTYEENETGITITGVSRWNIPDELAIPGKIDGKRVTAIGASAFQNRQDLIRVTLPVGVTAIETSAFASCSGLTGITIPNTVKSVGSDAFQNCTGLTDIAIPSSVKSIGSHAFRYCSNLARVSLAKGLQNIGNGAFQGCTSLKEVTIPEGVLFLYDNVFSDCRSLSLVSLPAGLRSIGNHAFYQCTSLKTIQIPSSVTSIGSFAFSTCGSLTEIRITEHVVTIGEHAFEHCTRLQQAAIPSGCRLGDRAFSDSCTVTRY